MEYFQLGCPSKKRETKFNILMVFEGRVLPSIANAFICFLPKLKHGMRVNGLFLVPGKLCLFLTIKQKLWNKIISCSKQTVKARAPLNLVPSPCRIAASNNTPVLCILN